MAWGEADGLPTRASLLPFEIERELQKFRSGGCELCRLRPTQAEPQVAELPVHCLRFAQHGINSKMVFGNGRRGDSSVYCLVHDLLCNRLSLAEIPPLQVVLDGDLFFSLDNRRLAAFKMLQGLWAHQVVKVPCVIWHKHTDDSEIRHKFKLAKTTTPELHHGLGIKLNGDLHEAWHMGEPLFRRPQEWCAPLQATSARQQGEGSANSKELETEAPTPPSQATGLCELAETPVEHPKKSKGKKWTKDNNAGKETQASSCSSNPPGPTMQAAESPSLVNQNEVAAKPPTTWAEIVGAKQPAPGVPAAPAPAAPALPASKAPEPTPKPPPPPPPQSPPTPAAAPWRPPLPPPSFPPPQQEACLPAPLSAPHCAPPASDCKEVAQNRCQDSFQTQLPSSGSFASSQDEPGEPLPESHQEAEGVADDFLSAEDAESYRSESDEDILGQDEPDFQEDAPADPSTERAVLEDLLSEMRQQRDVCHVGDLKGRLVSGTFRVLSGSDFRLRRSKSQLVVDQGPPQLLGCRVHIIGALNRNRAWDHDRCWVRILAARVAVEGVGVGRKQVKQDLGRAWDASTAQAAMLFGTVVCAREQQSPRQSKVVCARSRLVRSLNCMLFRPINGKFPMIRVPWNPQLEPPALHDLHVVELKSWRDGLPVGMHEEVLHMSNRDSDESVVYAIKRSLNLTDWEEHSKYCSIPIEEETIAISAKGADVQCDRQDLRNNFSICVEHPGWPGNMAFSLVEGELQVHVVDATAYLAAELSGSDLEAQARLRSCGAWLLDCEDKPAEHSLPLLQEEFVKKIDLTEGQDRLTLTFSFSINGGQLNRQDHFESITRCHRRLSYQAADHVGPGKTADLLEAVSTLVGQIEQAALGRGESFPLEHWDPHVGLQSRLDSRRIVGCLSFLVNLYAGRVLSNPALWSEFLSLDETQQVMPTWLYSRADTQNLRSLQRLLPPSEVTEVCAQVCTKQVIDALTSTLAQEHLSGEQRWAVQKALLRQIRMSLPGGFYQLGEKAPWPGPSKGQLFFRPKIFHASAPLSRYIDVLGQRMLKWLKGWRPGLCSWLCPSLRDIQEAVDRTNARLDSLRFAGFVMRQISRMRDLSVASRKISNAIVGYAGPGAFEVIIPSSSSAHFSLSVPVNTLRSATCSLEFDVDAQCLRIMNVDPWRRCSYSWVVKPWVTQVECVISRNFAQPIKHHASANAMIISEITFNSSAGPVSLSVGHRMYPEVFSEFPDLGHVHLMEKDLDAYAQTWHKIWRCRTHAAASEAAAYTEWMHPGRLHMEDGKVSCCVVLHGTDEHPRPQPGDLAILRCSPAEAAREVLLYGEVLDCKPSKSQWKIKACRTPNCSRANCGFLHPGEEAEGALFQLEVGLSEVSRHAQKEQKRFLEAADATAFKLQLVGVPVVDRQNLKLVEELPNKLRTRKGRESPIAAHLTSLQAPTVEQEQREMRPLATFQQVERSVREGAYAVRGSGLNDMQLSAVMRGLQHRFSVVQGPPGTGKTTFLVHLVTALTNLELDPSLSRSRSAQPAAAESFGRILVTTPSNQAADECLRRLVQESDIPAHYITRVYARTIEYKFGSKLRLGWDPYDSNLTRTEHMVADDLLQHALHHKVMHKQEVKALEARIENKTVQYQYDQVYESVEQQVLQKSRIVITTCSSALSHGALKEKKDGKQRSCVAFRSVVVDECAQATEPEVVLSVMRAEDRAILVGDHKQLGPVVTEHSLCKAFLVMLERPLLERLASRKEMEHRKKLCSTMLQQQYRMHNSICTFPSKHFYNNQLQNVQSLPLLPTVATVWPRQEEKVVWIDCDHPHHMGHVVQVGNSRSLKTSVLENNTSLQNPGEADLIVEVYKRLLRGGSKPEDIAIITPYKAQQQYIERSLKHVSTNSSRTAVGTVFKMQGSERHFVLLSFVRSVAEGWALRNLSMQSSSNEIRVSEPSSNPALRQTFETHIGIAGKADLLNVALTRAKSGLVIVGNRTVLSEGSEDFFQLATDLANRGTLLSEQEFRSRR